MNPHLQLNAADGISYSLTLDNINGFKGCGPAPSMCVLCWFVRELLMRTGPKQPVLHKCSQGVCGDVGYCSVQMVGAPLECLRETFESSVSNSALSLSGNYALFSAWNTYGI